MLRAWCLLGMLRAQLGTQCQALLHAKAVLLVDDGQAQSGELHFILDDGMRSHHQGRFAAGNLVHHGLTPFAFARAGQPCHGHAQRGQPGHEFAQMLLGQQFGGRHERALPAVVDCQRRRQSRDDRLARTHIALQQAVHR